VRSAGRGGSFADFRGYDFGFRVVCRPRSSTDH